MTAPGQPCVVCGAYPQEHRLAVHPFIGPDDDSTAVVVAELRGFASLLADDPADENGEVAVGGRNLADLIALLGVAADRLDGRSAGGGS